MQYINLGIHESSGSFSPTDISGLKLWLKADAITGKSDGDTVSTWSDSSGLGNDATAGTAPIYKTNIINGLPVVRFSSSILDTPSISWTNQTIFIVGLGSGSNRYAVSFSSGSENALIYGFAANTLEIYNNPRLSIGTFSSFSYATIIRTASTSTTVRLNGSQTGTTGTVSIPGSGAVRLGNHFLGSNPFVGDIAELLIYDAVVSGTDLTNVESYLADKYGL